MHTHTVNYSPSDHSTLQIIHLDEFTKAAGIVVVCRLGIPKGLDETTERETPGKFKGIKSKTYSALSNHNFSRLSPQLCFFLMFFLGFFFARSVRRLI